MEYLAKSEPIRFSLLLNKASLFRVVDTFPECLAGVIAAVPRSLFATPPVLSSLVSRGYRFAFKDVCSVTTFGKNPSVQRKLSLPIVLSNLSAGELASSNALGFAEPVILFAERV
jgi:hypothetical protein